MRYKCFREFTGKDLNLKSLFVPVDAELIRQGDVLYYGNKPVCIWRSQMAKDYLVWNGDGCADERLGYLRVIIYNPREMSWTEMVTEYDEETGEEKGKVPVTRYGRYTPEESEYLLNRYPQFFSEDGRFSDYFYVGSHVSDLKDMANYLNSHIEEN